MADRIVCKGIVEVVGKPKEHVEKAINMVVEKTAEIEGLTIERKEIAPIKSLKDEELGKVEKKIQDQKGELFSTFAEIEFSAKNLDVITSFCYEFLPSSLDIVEPEKINIDLQDVSKLMNDVLGKIHNADHIIKQLKFENSALSRNAELLLRNMIIVSLKSKEKNIDELSKATGIPSEQLKPFLESLIKENFIKQEDDIYKSA